MDEHAAAAASAPQKHAVGIADIDEAQLADWPKGADDPVIVAFLAPWCEVCDAMGDVVARFAPRAVSHAVLRRLDVERHPGVAERLNVRSVPAFVMFAREREIARFVGASTVDELVAFTERGLKEVPPAKGQADAPGNAAYGATPDGMTPRE